MGTEQCIKFYKLNGETANPWAGINLDKLKTSLAEATEIGSWENNRPDQEKRATKKFYLWCEETNSPGAYYDQEITFVVNNKDRKLRFTKRELDKLTKCLETNYGTRVVTRRRRLAS